MDTIILSDREMAFITRCHAGMVSSAIHQGLSAIMPVKHNDRLVVKPSVEPFIYALRPMAQRTDDLDTMEDAIDILRNEMMVAALQRAGIAARCYFRTHYTTLILVYSPNDGEPGEWATAAECRRLLDTLVNLPAPAAFTRWREKIAPWDSTYTQSDAQRDITNERAGLRAQYQAGAIDGEMYRLMYVQAAEFTNYVTTPGQGETFLVSG